LKFKTSHAQTQQKLMLQQRAGKTNKQRKAKNKIEQDKENYNRTEQRKWRKTSNTSHTNNRAPIIKKTNKNQQKHTQTERAQHKQRAKQTTTKTRLNPKKTTTKKHTPQPCADVYSLSRVQRTARDVL